MFEQLVLNVGLENVPYLQPKQLQSAGVQDLVRALKGVTIQLVEPEDDDSATSDMNECNACLPSERSETGHLGLNRRDPDDLEEGEISHHSSLPNAMNQDDPLSHGTYPDRGLASDTGAAPGRLNDFQSEDMDTTAQPSEVESYSDRPMESQDAQYTRRVHGGTEGDGESEMAKRRRLYPKISPYMIPTPTGVDNRWYQEEDLMNPREVAPPSCRVERPNVDGSIGGDNGHPLPAKRPSRQSILS